MWELICYLIEHHPLGTQLDETKHGELLAVEVGNPSTPWNVDICTSRGIDVLPIPHGAHGLLQPIGAPSPFLSLLLLT